MKRFTTSLIIVATLAVFSQATAKDASAQRRGRIRIGRITIEIPGIFPNPGVRPRPDPRPQLYRVSMYHPRTNGLIYSRTYTSRRAADQMTVQLRRRHWKMWKYNGIGERWHSRQFSNYSSASRYRPPFNLLGIASQYIRAARVTMVRVR